MDTGVNDGFGNESNDVEARAEAEVQGEAGEGKEKARKALTGLAAVLKETGYKADRPETVRGVTVDPRLANKRGGHGPVVGSLVDTDPTNGELAADSLDVVNMRRWAMACLKAAHFEKVREDRWLHPTGITAELGTSSNEVWLRAYWPGAHNRHESWAFIEHINLSSEDNGRSALMRACGKVDTMIEDARNGRKSGTTDFALLSERSERQRLEFVRLMPEAKLPTRAHADDAGFDLYTAEDTQVPAGAFVDVPTGVSMQIPDGYWARITGRSSTLRNHGLLVNEGIIDTGYTGPLFAAVRNLGDAPRTVHAGTRLAQVILHKNETELFDVHEVDGHRETTRGIKGFGSSGA